MEDKQDNSHISDETKSSEDNTKELLKKEKEEKLRKLKDKIMKASKYNSKAVEFEARRLNNDAYAKREARQEWIESKEKERKALKLRGISDKNKYLLETAEENQKKTESKKQKERNAVNNYGWNIFSEDAIYRGYEKRLKNLPTTPESAQQAEVSGYDPMDFALNSRVSDDIVNRIADDQKKRDEKNSVFSKRRTYYKQEQVDYISERNRTFNRKLDRYYNRFTGDIRANLERGTAL